MALPPTIPTSFVPKQATVPRSVSAFNPFMFLAYVIFFIWVIVGLLVFAYSFYLGHASKQKEAEVATAQSNIDQATVTEFIRLRDRFGMSNQILEKHVVLSRFFDDLEKLTVQNVRISKLKVTVQENRTAKVEIAGTARNFNALAAESTAFASNKNIKNAIFSGFSLDSRAGTVSFQVNADLEPGLLTQTASDAVVTSVKTEATTTPSSTILKGTGASTTTP